MSSDKKPAIEKRYAIPSKDSIKRVAESVGHDLDDETVGLLCEDVSYRVRQIVQSSSKFMRHAKRRKLTTEDVNRALKYADIQPAVGHGSGDTASSFYHVKEADVFVAEDPDVSPLDLAFRDELVCNPGETSVKAHWLAVEGVHRTSAQKPPERKISDDLLVYYDQTAKALLSSDRELMRTALADLRTNSKILPIFPYFVNFVSSGVLKVSHDINQLMRLLQTVQALMCNDSIFMEPRPYLQTLVQAVLYCITEPLAASLNPLNDHWRLRDYAARLLAQITHKWNNVVNQLMFKNTQAFKDVLLSDRAPSSHYGAVVALTALGVQALEKVLIPHLPRYLILRHGNLTSVNNNIRSDSYKVDGAVLRACELVLKQKVDDSTQLAKLAKLYHDLYQHYGESLSVRLPQEHSSMILLARKPEKRIVLHEPLRSGEEMLAEFMDMVKRDHPNYEDSKSEMTDRSQNDDDMDSPASFKSDRSDRSDFDEKPEYSHLAVKSTVNDPNLGIKLTITKKPLKKARRKRMKFKVEDVFENVKFERYHPFVFNVPRLVKWNSKASSKDFSLDFIATRESHEFKRLFASHPPYWTAKKRIKKKAYVVVTSASMMTSL